jgi:hypothetical protein
MPATEAPAAVTAKGDNDDEVCVAALAGCDAPTAMAAAAPTAVTDAAMAAASRVPGFDRANSDVLRVAVGNCFVYFPVDTVGTFLTMGRPIRRGARPGGSGSAVRPAG